MQTDLALELATTLVAMPCAQTLRIGIDAAAVGAEGMKGLLGGLIGSGGLSRLEELFVAGDGYSWAEIEPLIDAFVVVARADNPCPLRKLELRQSSALDGIDLLGVALSAIKIGCPGLKKFNYEGCVDAGG